MEQQTLTNTERAWYPEAEDPRPLTPTAAHRARLGLEVLAAALVSGSLGNTLLRVEPWGVNAGLWMAALLAVITALAWRHQLLLPRQTRGFLALALLFAALLAWRASPALVLLNIASMLIAMALASTGSRTSRLWRAGILDYAGWLVSAGIRVATGALVLLLGEVRWRELNLSRRTGQAAAVLRGVLLAAPLLLLFGLLFASADPVFEGMVERLFRQRLDDVLPSLFWIAFWGWISAGYMRQLLRRDLADTPLPGRWSAASLQGKGSLGAGGTEVVVILTLLNVLFLSFVLVQFRYLFGGGTLVEETVGLSYAEYARRGFFELVAVAALLLPVLLMLHALLGEEIRRYETRFRTLAGVLLLLLFLVLASAAERMRLYQAEFGLTELRFYTSAFMVWLTLVLVWFAATVLRNRRERFVGGALIAALALVGVLNLVNPDARIAETNLARTTSAERPDVGYLTRLSMDAAPVLVRALPDLTSEEACAVALRLAHPQERESTAVESADWRTWNRSRAQAARLAQDPALAQQAERCRRR